MKIGYLVSVVALLAGPGFTEPRNWGSAQWCEGEYSETLQDTLNLDNTVLNWGPLRWLQDVDRDGVDLVADEAEETVIAAYSRMKAVTYSGQWDAIFVFHRSICDAAGCRLDVLIEDGSGEKVQVISAMIANLELQWSFSNCIRDLRLGGDGTLWRWDGQKYVAAPE